MVEIVVDHRGVEHDGQAQVARSLDVFLAYRVQLDLVREPFALLRHVDMEHHVDQSGFHELLEQIALGSNPVGEQRRPHPFLPNPPDDFDQLTSLAQRGIAARHLHVGVRAIVVEDHVDASEYFLQR